MNSFRPLLGVALSIILLGGLIGCGATSDLIDRRGVVATLDGSPGSGACETPLNAELRLSNPNVQITAGHVVEFSLDVQGCTGSYQAESQTFGSPGIRLFKTYHTAGTYLEQREVRALGTDGAAVQTVQTNSVTVTVLAAPSLPVPGPGPGPGPGPSFPPGPIACAIVKQGTLNFPGQSVAFSLIANGAITSASLNGLPIQPGQPVPVAPLFDGSYVANGIVSGPAGTAFCQAVFQPPRCSLVVLEASAYQVRGEMRLQGAIARAVINGQERQLPGQNLIPFSFVPTGPGTITGQVYGPEGDNGSCAAHFAYPTTVAVGGFVPYYFTSGFSPADPNSFLMGGGVKSSYGWWSAMEGRSNAPIHTNNRVQRANECAPNEIAVAFGASNIVAPWAQSICAELLPGLELYEPRTVEVIWSRENGGSCASGEVLTGARFDAIPGLGEWGGRLVLSCAKLRWTAE